MAIKRAKIITFTLATRVIVDDDATDHQITAKAQSAIQDKIANGELVENIESIELDNDMPLGSLVTDVYYQPSPETTTAFEDGTLGSFEVFESKELCRQAFPDATIVEYYGDDIENPTFVDDEFKVQRVKK